MKRRTTLAWLLLLGLLASPVLAAEPIADLREAVPADAFLAVYGMHNPERDAYRAHAERIIETVRETRLVERIVETVTENLSEDQRAGVLAMLDKLEEATAPIDLEALLDCQQVSYAQRLQAFEIHAEHKDHTILVSHHLALLQLPDSAAHDYHQGISNLLELIEAMTGGRATLQTEDVDGVELTWLAAQKSPQVPAVALVGDVVVFSTSVDFARDSIELLLGADRESKFDDPRVAEALAELPQPEDAIVFYDGRQQFGQMGEMFENLQAMVDDKPEAARWFKLAKTIFHEVAIMDYVAAVEYTDGERMCTDTYGKLMPDFEGRLLTELLTGGEAFEDWHSWVPAEATSYTLSTGIDLHALYERKIEFINEHVPELHKPLEKFMSWQREADFDLDVDLLQSFSGECVAVTLPADSESAWCGADYVWAMRCHKPSRVRWLMGRAIDGLNQFPMVAAQQVELVESDELEGFEQLHVALLQLFDMRPVIGFDDGWMFIGSNAAAVEKVLLTRAGEHDSIATTEQYEQFELDVEGPVRSVHFFDLGEQMQRISTGLRQAGLIMPMFIGIGEAEAESDEDRQELVPLRVMAELFPALSQIMGEFDFLQQQLKVVQDGDEPGTWREYQVILISPSEDSEE